jgi:hypothetical protein
MIVNLADHNERAKLVARMHADIDAACKEEFKEDARTHLGASIIGHDCKAYAWNTFRWLKQEDFSGQMLRLFNRGHEEEARFVRWLTLIGFEVRELDPETQKQFRISGSKGHFGGSLDSMMRAPERYNLPFDLIFLGEFKTHNENSFTKLAGPKTPGNRVRTGGKGVQLSKPMHFRQCCSYGRVYGFKYGIYCAVNKDTDELYFEIVQISDNQADDLFRKADDIIFSQTQPMKIAQVATYTNCKYCNFKGICHLGEIPEKNCRSCVNAFPVDNAEWNCHVYNVNIPIEVIKTGCQSWTRII